jgi:transposase
MLEYVPAKLEVHVHVRPKYACRYCKDGVASPPLPPRPIARGIAGPGLIAQIVVAKFGDHLPLYRQEDFFTRHGLHIPRSTLCDWVQAAAELVKPLYERQKELVLQSPVLWTDDTPVTVLTGGKEGSRQGRFWAYIGDEHPYTVYDFTESRARDGPATFLAGFRVSHADAYGGYTTSIGVERRDPRSCCGAHAAQVLRHAGQHHGTRTRSGSGSDSCTTSRIRPARYRPTRGVTSGRAKRNRCLLLSTHALRSWRDGRCPRAS